MYPAYLVILFVTGKYGVGRGDEDDMEDTPNRNYRKQPLLLKSNHLFFTRAHKLTSCSLPSYFQSDPTDNVFATNVSYSVGHLTFILQYDPRTPSTTVAKRRAQGGISRVSKIKVELPTQTIKKFIWLLSKTVTSQGSLFPGSNLERTV